MKTQKETTSLSLKQFLDFVENTKSDYQYHVEAMKKEERITQDYLHMLELSELNSRERSKIATQLAANRKNRRSHKDAVEELEPIVEFFDDPRNKSVLHALSQLLGQIRKVETYHKNRFYVPKVIEGKAIVDAPSEIHISNVS